MKDDKFTPGPWVQNMAYHDPGSYDVWTPGGRTWVANAGTRANARLIALAPELLAEVRKLAGSVVATCAR